MPKDLVRRSPVIYITGKEDIINNITSFGNLAVVFCIVFVIIVINNN